MVFTKYTLVMCAYLFIKKSTRLLAEVRRVLFRGHNVILEESKTRMDEAKAERARGATLAGKSRLPFKGENSRRLRHRHDLHCWHRRANARFNAGLLDVLQRLFAAVYGRLTLWFRAAAFRRLRYQRLHPIREK